MPKSKPKPITTKQYIWNNKSLQFAEKFNESLEPYYAIMCQVSRITFPNNFNYPILLFPNTTYLNVKYGYTFPIVLTRNIRILNIQSTYCHKLKLPSKFESLIVLELGTFLELNKNMKNLDIKYYEIGALYLNKTMYGVVLEEFDEYIDTNKRLGDLCIGDGFNQPLILPKHLKILQIGYAYNKKILLPRFIIRTHIGCDNTRHFILECGDLLHLSIDSHDHYLIDNLPDNKNTIILEHRMSNFVCNLPKNWLVEGRF